MEITPLLPISGQELPLIFGYIRGFSKFQILFHVSRGSRKDILRVPGWGTLVKEILYGV
jgi:hypothetical protein